jgi:hypothetical protein
VNTLRGIAYQRIGIFVRRFVNENHGALGGEFIEGQGRDVLGLDVDTLSTFHTMPSMARKVSSPMTRRYRSYGCGVTMALVMPVSSPQKTTYNRAKAVAAGRPAQKTGPQRAS